MTKQQFLGGIGLWTVLLPFFGISNTWKLNLVVLTGVVILIVYWQMRKESQSVSTTKNTHEVDFVENGSVEKPTQTIENQ
jgi:low affinity Fe/Cu permease